MNRRAVYCYCKNTYSRDCGKKKGCKCKAPDYWKQGIGDISNKGVK